MACRYDVAMDINTVGPFRIMSFAQRFRRLKLFLQVSTGDSECKTDRNYNEFALKLERLHILFQKLISCVLCLATAYVNGQRQGLMQEKPFRMGDTIAKELGSASECKSVMLDIEEEIKLAFHSRRHSNDSASFAHQMKDLGLERYVVVHIRTA